MADDLVVNMLRSWAEQFTGLLLKIFHRKKRRLPSDVLCRASQIATRLQIACPYIESLPYDWIAPEVNDLCLHMLRQLVVMCTWPERVDVIPGLRFRQYINALARPDQSTMERSIYSYFSHPGNKGGIDSFSEDCRKLEESLAPTSAEESRGLQPNLWNVTKNDYSNHNRALFDVLQTHCECTQNLRTTPENSRAWHPTRLYLEGNSKTASFGILVSSLDMSFWQELRLSVSSGAAACSEMLDHSYLCSLVKQQPFARIFLEFEPDHQLHQPHDSERQEFMLAAGQGESLASILQHYHLTPRDRVLLSYSIARAYWQYYDSDLMRRKWTSKTIWLMPTSNDDHKDELPLQAFVSFPFNAPDDRAEDFLGDLKLPLNHRCPRIFALGVLLLEIGRARPFTTPVYENLSSQINFDHATAINLVRKLRDAKWDGFSHMKFFVDAVEYCLDGGNFIQGTSGSTRRGLQPFENHSDIFERRKNLYHSVVRPLEWLAVKGFKSNSAETTYISKVRNTGITTAPGPPQALEAPIKATKSAFNSGLTVSNNWVQNLVRISAHIDHIRSQLEMTTPIRVAILDTGISFNMPYYQDEEYGDDRKKQIECFRDFLEPDSFSKKDDFGHGSLMARLVAESTPFESTPFAKIIVARVARNTRDLVKCQDKIAEAIRWAGKQGADIISMSFGFPRNHDRISEAIHEIASRKGGVIFLASAGNSADEAEAFPARHSEVISIYATNRHGTFLESNSQRPNDGANILGTYGDGLPPEIKAEFDREYRGVCQPGSSVATAVAASMAAMMLAYIAALRKLFFSSTSSKTLQGAHDSRGMEALFRKMAPKPSDGRFFINPVQFWRESNTDEARFHDICSCLWKISRYM